MELVIIPGIFSGSVWQIIGDSSTFGLLILAVLAIMSFISWVIIFSKWRQFKSVEHDNGRFAQHFSRSRSLTESIGQAKAHSQSPLSNIYSAGYSEMTQLLELRNQGGGLQENKHKLEAEDFEIIEMGMERRMSDEMAILEQKVVFLATTANAAPFLGLLGTVVGIMDSFWSIGERGSASLAVVAPGIAEALLATIVGLGAAIPAVIAFNWANNKMKIINDQANGFILEFLAKARKETI